MVAAVAVVGAAVGAQEPAGEPAVAADACGEPEGVEPLLRQSNSGRLSARLGPAARIAGRSRIGGGHFHLPYYSSTFGLVITQPWKLFAGRIRASCSVIAPEKSGAKITARKPETGSRTRQL